MDDNIYEAAITHSKDNPFKRYLEFLNDLGELSQIEEEFYKGIGRELSACSKTQICQRYIRCRCLWHFIITHMC